MYSYLITGASHGIMEGMDAARAPGVGKLRATMVAAPHTIDRDKDQDTDVAPPPASHPIPLGLKLRWLFKTGPGPGNERFAGYDIADPNAPEFVGRVYWHPVEPGTFLASALERRPDDRALRPDVLLEVIVDTRDTVGGILHWQHKPLKSLADAFRWVELQRRA